MIFLDTNILIAAVQQSHPHHLPSRALLERTQATETVIAAHTLAEVYATLTRMPPPERISPAVAMQAIEAYLKRITPIVLTTEEYLETIRQTASGGHCGGIVYDALLLGCARKCRAEFVYTWNTKHFKTIAPDLADRIATP